MGREKFKRPLLTHSRDHVVNAATSAQTVGPLGIFALATTSTGAPTVFTLGRAVGGEECVLEAQVVGATSSGPIHVNTSTTADTVTVGTSSGDMILLSSAGASVHLIAKNSTYWMVAGGNNFTLSTST